MNKLVFFLAIICSISILFASCSKDEETQTDAEKAEAAEAAAIAAIGLSGTWKGTCGSASSDNSSYGVQSFVFSGTSFSSDWSVYSDSECSTKNSTSIEAFKLDIGDSYTLASGNTAHKGVITLVSNLLTLYTSSYVNIFNSISYCGKEWVINTAIDMAGLTCGGTEQDSAGVKTYISYYIYLGNPNGTSLQFGTSTADNVTSVDAETYTKQ